MTITKYLDYMPKIAKFFLGIWLITFFFTVCFLIFYNLNPTTAILLSAILASTAVIINLITSLNINFQNENKKEINTNIDMLKKTNETILSYFTKTTFYEYEIMKIKQNVDFEIGFMTITLRRLYENSNTNKELKTLIRNYIKPTICILKELREEFDVGQNDFGEIIKETKDLIIFNNQIEEIEKILISSNSLLKKLRVSSYAD